MEVSPVRHDQAVTDEAFRHRESPDRSKRRLKICFVAPGAWPVLIRDRSARLVGGAEVQQSTIATALAARGLDVSMVCLNFGQPAAASSGDVTVFRAYEANEGWPILRFLYPRMTSVIRAMQRADADIYYQRACGALTGIVAAFCRARNKKFVYAAAHDHDFDPTLPLIQYGRDRAIYRWGLRNASQIVAQTSRQQMLCANSIGLISHVVPSCYAPPGEQRRDPLGYVLWVATIREWKRPELFIDLARQLPSVRFRMIGGGDDLKYFEQVRRQASSVPNLEFIGFVPYPDIEEHFDGARVFVNTSASEGFPNTFLQAWARGIPVVSFFGPESQQGGVQVVWQVTSLDEMVKSVDSLAHEDDVWHNSGELSKRFFEGHHDVEKVTDIYMQLFERLARR